MTKFYPDILHVNTSSDKAASFVFASFHSETNGFEKVNHVDTCNEQYYELD